MLKCGYCKDIPAKAYKEAPPMQIIKKAFAEEAKKPSANTLWIFALFSDTQE
jgi:hypothetical protein